LVHFTLWNYNSHNDNSYGDFWNGEDFSIFSALPKVTVSPRKPSIKSTPDNAGISPISPTLSQKALSVSIESAFDLIDSFFEDPNAHHLGGRALEAVIRPYAAKTSGKLIYSGFDVKRSIFELIFVTPKDTSTIQNLDNDLYWTSEIYVPQFHFGVHMQPEIVVSDGKWTFDPIRQTIYWKINPTDTCIDPISREYLNWLSCSKSAASQNLRKEFNFHTLQVCKVKDIVRKSTGSLDSTSNCVIS
jgi:Glycoside hydrolase family 5 C-terminal domain